MHPTSIYFSLLTTKGTLGDLLLRACLYCRSLNLDKMNTMLSDFSAVTQRAVVGRLLRAGIVDSPSEKRWLVSVLGHLISPLLRLRVLWEINSNLVYSLWGRSANLGGGTPCYPQCSFFLNSCSAKFVTDSVCGLQKGWAGPYVPKCPL